MKLLTYALLGWGSLGFVAMAQDGRVMQAYPLYTRDAAALISMVEAVSGTDGRVIYDKPNGRLLVLATADAQVDVADVIRQLNVPPVNVRIEVAVEESKQEQLVAMGVEGGADVVIVEDTVNVDASVRPYAQRRSDRHGRTTRQTLLLQSGGEATLHIGEEVPNADWLVQYGINQGYMMRALELREVGAILRVQARVIGEGPLISLKLTPEITGLADGGKETIQFTRLSTDITVQDGQTVDIGGLTENSEFYSRFLVGMDRNGKRRSLAITVTPRIERPAGAPVPTPTAVSAGE